MVEDEEEDDEALDGMLGTCVLAWLLSFAGTDMECCLDMPLPTWP